MNMSFSKTTPQFRARTKTVTRRLGWLRAKPGDVVIGIEQGQGLKKGQHVTRLGPVRFVDVRSEPLVRMWHDEDYGRREVILEGFPELSPVEFINMFAAFNRCAVDETITRIEFEYLDEPAVVDSAANTDQQAGAS